MFKVIKKDLFCKQYQFKFISINSFYINNNENNIF